MIPTSYTNGLYTYAALQREGSTAVNNCKSFQFFLIVLRISECGRCRKYVSNTVIVMIGMYVIAGGCLVIFYMALQADTNQD